MNRITLRGKVRPKAASACAAVAGLALVLSVGSAHAARPGGGGGGGGATCSISTSPSPAIIDAGQSVTFTGAVSGKPPATYSWVFAEGSPASAGNVQSATVVYATDGTFAATLNGINGKGESCAASVSVQVNPVSAPNRAPVANADAYATGVGQSLTVAAPGVLGNDSDPDGDPITAVLATSPGNGSLQFNANGSFTYAPAAGFTGQASFTYRASDGKLTSAPATVTITVAEQVSINSTSANGQLQPIPVDEQDPVFGTDYRVLAINDLGMHCGDLDTRISSILPPFNVLHAQVVARGVTGRPRILGEGEVALDYSAASNPDDPAIGKVISGDALSSVVNGEVYKTNFWDVAFPAYDPFYPKGILAGFYDPNNPANNVDIGLPVPDVERLYLGDGELHATQQAMPGLNAPYTANEPQPFEEHFGSFPFFERFPFGYTASNINWFEAAGVPIAAFDDFGRENPYPLVRVRALLAGARVASLDTVMPISGEAECQRCHAAAADGGNGEATKSLSTVTTSIEDPAHETVPNAVSVEWASDRNILALHDQKHGTQLTSDVDSTGRAAKPVVCQVCHYTPALDLAQLGPLGPENDGPLVLNGVKVSDSLANGRDQLKHKSMSNVMHSHHGSTGLFPDMPPPIDAQGNRRDPVLTQQILEQTCYSCHPGKRTQCMRGAMANGGLVCQDCHGQMADVGDDFTRTVSPSSPGTFELAADFYTNPDTPRVPWANEPGCGSCHTGHATSNLAGTEGTLVNPTDVAGNPDGIRLLAAYRQGDTKATPIVPTNKAFAEDVVTADDNPAAAGNPKLYRVSNGHGGLFCQACHGSTHAEWPNASPAANDNVPASQLQGHSGFIAECQVCHEPTDSALPLGLNGPHGMHPVSDLAPDTSKGFKSDIRWNKDHKEYRSSNNTNCKTCHGADLKGTVLSRSADDRTVQCKNTNGSLPECRAGQERAVIPKGTVVGCGLCHQMYGSGGG